MAFQSDDGGAVREDVDILGGRRRGSEEAFDDEDGAAPAYFPPSNFPTALETTSRLLLSSRPPTRAKIRTLGIICTCVVGMIALARSPVPDAAYPEAESLAVVPSGPEMDSRALIDPAHDAVEEAMAGRQRFAEPASEMAQPKIELDARALIEPADAVGVEMAPPIERQQQVEIMEQQEDAQMPADDDQLAFDAQEQEPAVAIPQQQQGGFAGAQQGSSMSRANPGAWQAPSQGRWDGAPGPRPDFDRDQQRPQQARPFPNQGGGNDVSRADPYLSRLRNQPTPNQLQQQQGASPPNQPRRDDLTPEERLERQERFRMQQEKLEMQTKRIEELKVVQERAREEKIFEKLYRNKKVEDEVAEEQVQVPSYQEEEFLASEQAVQEQQELRVQPQLRTVAIESDEASPFQQEVPVSSQTDYRAPPPLEGPASPRMGGYQANFDEAMNGAGALRSMGALAIASFLLLAMHFA